MALIAAIVAVRGRWQISRAPAGLVATYLGVILLLCKTLGATLYALVAAPIVLFTKPRTWVTVAVTLLLFVCAYPLLRTYELVPLQGIASAASTVSTDRSSSFQFRVENEEKLLARANEKPFFGWGTWGRNRIFLEGSGQDISTTDGAWIITLGMFGWLGYLCLFGLFAAAAWRARNGVRGPVTQSSLALGGVTLLLAMNVIDMLPNAALTPLTYAMAGSIAGCVRAKSARSARPLKRSLAPAAGH
jgi:hypothetical protein